MTELLAIDTTPQKVKLRVEDFVMLDDAGVFDDYAKSELLDGDILVMNAQHRPHSLLKNEIVYRLRTRFQEIGSNLLPLAEASVAMPPVSLPEPDIVVTSEARGEGFIPLASVTLVVEVSDTTLSHDLSRKAVLYAMHGIPEYWVADLRGRVIHQHWSPSAEGYAERREVAFGQPLSAATLPGLEIATGGF